MATVKTAVSLDASLLKQLDAAATELEMPRSRLLALAAERFLRKYQNAKLLEELNRAPSEGPSAAEIEHRRIWKKKHRRRLEGEW